MYRFVLAVVMTMCFTLSAQLKKEPDDLSVGKYKMLLDKFEDDFELEANRAPSVVQLEKEIKHLSRPLKARQEVTILVDNGRGFAPQTGILKKVTPKVAELGVKFHRKQFIDPLDWMWLEGLNDPEKLKTIIKEKKSAISEQKKLFVKNRSAQKLIDLGYTKRFLEESVILGPNFVKKTDIGDGSIVLQAVVYTGPEHMSEFVELEITYKGSEELAGVLVVEYPEGSGKDVPLCNFGVKKPSGKVGGKSFKRLKFFFERSALEKLLGSSWHRALKDSRFVMMKDLHGMWELKAAQSRNERGSSNVPCSDCWGAGEVFSIGSVDISTYAKETLERAHAKEAIRKEGYKIVGKYKNPEGQKKVQCPTCEGSGDAGRKSRVRGVKIVVKLDPKSVVSYSPKDYAAFEKLYKSVKPIGDVSAIKKKYREQHVAEREKEIIAEAHKEIDELVAEFTKKYMKRSYEQLEKRFRKGWFTRKEILAQKTSNSPGVGPVMLQGEPDGYAPDKLFGSKVRRFSEWLVLRNFKRIGGIEDGFKLNPVYYRVVEVGGADIDAVDEPEPVEDEPGKSAPGRRPSYDEMRELPPPPPSRRRTGRPRPDDEMMMEGEMPPAGTGETVEEPQEPEDEVPEDIKDRIYVIQYAASFSSDGKPFKVTTKMNVKFVPDINTAEEINFDLDAKDKALSFSHDFKIVAGWRGWLIGSKIISFEQLLSMFDFKTITFKADIK